MKNVHGVFAAYIFFIFASQAQPIRPRVEYQETPGEGAALMKEIISRAPAGKASAYGLLKIRDAAGRRSEIPIKYRLFADNKGWQEIYESKAIGTVPAERLAILHAPGGPNKYLFATAPVGSDTFPDPSPIPANKLSEPFANSDFWRNDLGLEFFYWPSQHVIRKELAKTRSCKVVESINPRPEEGGYSRVVSWIDEEFLGPVRAQGYDKNGKLVKEFSIRKVKNNQITELEIRNEQTDSQTRLEYDLEVKPAKAGTPNPADVK